MTALTPEERKQVEAALTAGGAWPARFYKLSVLNGRCGKCNFGMLYFPRELQPARCDHCGEITTVQERVRQIGMKLLTPGQSEMFL